MWVFRVVGFVPMKWVWLERVMGNRMISVTRLGGTEVVINTDLIVTVEKTPDTVITLTTGDRIMVRESVEDVVARAAEFRHRVMQGPGVRADARDHAASLGAGRKRARRFRRPRQARGRGGLMDIGTIGGIVLAIACILGGPGAGRRPRRLAGAGHRGHHRARRHHRRGHGRRSR